MEKIKQMAIGSNTNKVIESFLELQLKWVNLIGVL